MATSPEAALPFKTAFESITERVLFGQPMTLVIHPDNVTDQLRFEAECAGFEIQESRYCDPGRCFVLDMEALYTKYVAEPVARG